MLEQGEGKKKEKNPIGLMMSLTVEILTTYDGSDFLTKSFQSNRYMLNCHNRVYKTFTSDV